MAVSDHIKDLITMYQSMPDSPRRAKVITHLQQAYMLATSDELAAQTLITTKQKEL